jgi:hypothetical protein
MQWRAGSKFVVRAFAGAAHTAVITAKADDPVDTAGSIPTSAATYWIVRFRGR